MKKYKVRLSALMYGEVEIQANSEKEVIEKGEKIFNADSDSIFWHSGELADIEVEIEKPQFFSSNEL